MRMRSSKAVCYNTSLHLTESASVLPLLRSLVLLLPFEKQCRKFPQVNSTVMRFSVVISNPDMYYLDFSRLPRIERIGLFKGIPGHYEKQFGALNLPETLDRLKGAGRFITEVSTLKDKWLNRAYLRAGLSEFRSVAQALHWDLGRREVYSPEKSSNPLIHLIFRLRRIAVYVGNAATTEKEVEVTYRIFDEDREATLPALLLRDLERYLRQENLSDYDSKEITRICDWFEEEQSKFGAPHVLLCGILQYGLELRDVYSDRTR